MAKQVILFRHGKSDWDVSFATDHARPLAPRGVRAARSMGKLLAASGQLPDLVITSSAVRARTTVELAVAAGKWPCPVTVTDALYDASIPQVLEVVHQLPETAGAVLLAGHEPTWSELASSLIGGGSLTVPTAAMVRIDFDVDTWPAVGPRQGTLIWLLPPKFFP